MQQQLQSKYATRENTELKVLLRFPDSSKAECSFYYDESTQVRKIACNCLDFTNRMMRCSHVYIDVANDVD